ncbi:MAG: TonB-dependent receptor [Oxalobacteraceae bacterium]|nr:TonB-dependent receptor [Oxalobacteraceae bacterium]
MNFFASRSRIPAWTPLALVSALSACFIAPVSAQTHNDKTLAPVVVTASRFANDPAFSPIGATVITADQIREAGVGNVNEAIRKIGGVHGRQNFFGTQDFSLDMRGFGSTSDNNLVVMVDGVRLSESEFGGAVFSSIPIETVERIEFVRGGSSVLYGDGATGGVIHIITKRPQLNATHGSVTAEIGQFNHKAVRASVAKGWEGFSLDANVSKLESDNYRDNNAVDQENFSGGAQWASNEGRAGLRVDIARQDSRLAGGLSLAQFEENPRQTFKPDDFASIDTDRYTAFIERKLGTWEVAAELSHRERTTNFGSDGAPSSIFKGKQTQFSPRVRNVTAQGSMTNELVAGFDFLDWSRDTDSTFSREHATQKSKAVYARDEIHVGPARVALGARHEIFDKNSIDPVGGTNYAKSHSLNAWELQGSYDVTSMVKVFAKTGRSFRVANVDENGFTPVFNTPLEAQSSRDLEIGGSVGDASKKITARLFRHALNNEIFFDPTAGFFGANVNLDPTRRQGVEIEASMRLATAFILSANLQHVSAKFTDGPNAGRELVLVPNNTVSVRLNWLPGNDQTANIGLQWVDSQRYGGDFDNTCTGRIPSFTTLDGRYAKRFGAWELAIAGSNLTNRDYFSQAFSCRGGIYPDNGRQLKLSARYDF